MRGSMKVILYLSDMMIPFVVFYIVGIGIIQKNKVYDDFIEGAKDGLKTVCRCDAYNGRADDWCWCVKLIWFFGFFYQIYS